MITKIWLRCPSILKANGELLNFFWYFLGQKSFDENDKVAILEIYHEFLCDLKKKFSSNNEEDELNLGGFIDTMKTDINSHLGILFSTNVALRRIWFKVIREWYLQGLIIHQQAAEFFMICLNDSSTVLDQSSKETFNEASLDVLRDICAKDTKVLFSLDLQRVIKLKVFKFL